MSGVQRCRWLTRVDECALDDGALALRWFGLTREEIEKRVGRFSRGKRVGKLRGWIVFRNCIEGGWCGAIGGVVRPSMVFAVFVERYEEIGRISNLPSDEFMGMATRVDSQYGHIPPGLRPKGEPEPAPDPKPLEVGEELLFGKKHRLDTIAVKVVDLDGDSAVLLVVGMENAKLPFHLTVNRYSFRATEEKWEGYRVWRKS